MNGPWYKTWQGWAAVVGGAIVILGQILTFLQSMDNGKKVDEVQEHQQMNTKKIDDVHKEVKAVRTGAPPPTKE
jgi:hypothetical protein